MLIFRLPRRKLVAAATAVAFGILLYIYLGQVERRALMYSTIPAAVLAVDVSKGTVITPEHLQLSQEPGTDVPASWVSVLEAIGKVVLQDLAAGSVLTSEHLEVPGESPQEQTELEASCAQQPMYDNLFAVTVPASEARGLAPGDSIDLLGVFPPKSGSSEQSVLLAQRAYVFEVSTPATSDAGDTYGWMHEPSVVLTVGVDDATVHRLALADEFGKIRVIKRNSAATRRKQPFSNLKLDSILAADSTSAQMSRRGGDNAAPIVEDTAPAKRVSSAMPQVTVIRGTKLGYQFAP